VPSNDFPTVAVVALGPTCRRPVGRGLHPRRAATTFGATKVTLEYDPGESGRFMATALDWQGTEAGYGGGSTVAEALLRVHRKQADGPSQLDSWPRAWP
jgi:hypothetical protein